MNYTKDLEDALDSVKAENVLLRGACVKPDAVDDYLRVCRELSRLGKALRAIRDRACDPTEDAINDVARIAGRALDALPPNWLD